MKKVNNKKGFTLAELLVVVAILAVLIAIAVPIFGGALDNAEQRVKESNARAIRSAAMVQILTNDIDKGTWGWQAKANVDDKGNVTGLTVTEADAAVADVLPDDPDGDYTVGLQPMDVTP